MRNIFFILALENNNKQEKPLDNIKDEILDSLVNIEKLMRQS